MSDIVWVTEEGLKNMKDELATLIAVKRPEISERLQKAIAEGDLKENADYAYAKQEQSFIEGRITELQNLIGYAQIIVDEGPTGIVHVGSTVTIVDSEFDEEETYRIVGAQEANPANGYISNESPIGRALLGKKKGAKVKVKTPGGDVVFKITAIE
jgi:transcription elongation factor GreA